jgi:hypothetical protein
MPRRLIRLASLAACLVLAGATASAAHTESDYLDAASAGAADPAELRQAWEQAWVHLPGSEPPDSRPAIVGPFGSAYVQERLQCRYRRVGSGTGGALLSPRRAQRRHGQGAQLTLGGFGEGA